MPSELAEKVVPVMEVNPKLLRRCNIVRGGNQSTTGTFTIYTTPTGKEFYLSAATLSLTKDAACDASSGVVSMFATVDGVSQTIVRLSVLTLTAQDKEIALTFSVPIKVDANTNITVGGAFTAGNLIRGGSIIGYTVDNPNA